MRITRKQLRRIIKEEFQRSLNEQTPVPTRDRSKIGRLLSKVKKERMTASQALASLSQEDLEVGVFGDPSLEELQALAAAEMADQMQAQRSQYASRADLTRAEIREIQSAMIRAAGLSLGSAEAQRALGCRSRDPRYCPDGIFGKRSVALWNMLSLDSNKVSSVADINSMHRADTLSAAVDGLAPTGFDSLADKFRVASKSPAPKSPAPKSPVAKDTVSKRLKDSVMLFYAHVADMNGAEATAKLKTLLSDLVGVADRKRDPKDSVEDERQLLMGDLRILNDAASIVADALEDEELEFDATYSDDLLRRIVDKRKETQSSIEIDYEDVYQSDQTARMVPSEKYTTPRVRSRRSVEG